MVLFDGIKNFKDYYHSLNVLQKRVISHTPFAGVESTEPQPGVNLKVTTWSDDSRTTHKIIK
jgi:hypothetical protein